MSDWCAKAHWQDRNLPTTGFVMIEWNTDPEFIAAMTDSELLAAFQRTDGESTEAENLLAEIKRRNLDL